MSGGQRVGSPLAVGMRVRIIWKCWRAVFWQGLGQKYEERGGKEGGSWAAIAGASTCNLVVPPKPVPVENNVCLFYNLRAIVWSHCVQLSYAVVAPG